MKLIINSIILAYCLVLSIACNPEDDPILSPDELCDQVKSIMTSGTFAGTFFVCNAIPAEMSFPVAEASVEIIGQDAKITLGTISNELDTSFLNPYRCQIFEDSIAVIYVSDELTGLYCYFDSKTLYISFPYKCGTIGSFEGYLE